MQKDFLSKLLNLNEKSEEYLSILEEGQCIARVNSIKRPFLLWVPYVERHWLKRGDVNRKNKLILKKLNKGENDTLEAPNDKVDIMKEFEDLMLIQQETNIKTISL